MKPLEMTENIQQQGLRIWSNCFSKSKNTSEKIRNVEAKKKGNFEKKE